MTLAGTPACHEVCNSTAPGDLRIDLAFGMSNHKQHGKVGNWHAGSMYLGQVETSQAESLGRAEERGKGRK